MSVDIFPLEIFDFGVSLSSIGSNMEEKSEPFVSHGIVKYDLFGWTNGLKMNNID